MVRMGCLAAVVIAAVAMSSVLGADQPAQGVRGTVVRQTGNFMPGPGARGGKTEPLSVPVHVFKGRIKPFAGPAKDHPALVRSVTSDAKGSYACGLEPGEYTVVAEIDGCLYLNSFDGDGCWTTVKVVAGAWAAWDVKDTSGAAF